jgi:hypothetical protein
MVVLVVLVAEQDIEAVQVRVVLEHRGKGMQAVTVTIVRLHTVLVVEGALVQLAQIPLL